MKPVSELLDATRQLPWADKVRLSHALRKDLETERASQGAKLGSPAQGRLLYGCDYNPEQWSEEVWVQDVKLMKEAHVNFVSLGIFAWTWLEPRPGVFEFEGLDRVLALLHEGGIFVNLATATASPPPWLARMHPESLPMRADGTRIGPGARQHFAPASPAYRYYAARLVRAIARRYHDHPALVSWHINNEYACHVQESFDSATVQAFRHWLERRHGSLDALNAAWGTAFWSQRYGSFDEVLAPTNLASFKNPGHALDWRRFSNWVLLDLFRMERACVREFSLDVPINTNFLGFSPHLDYFEWAKELDYASWDSYPDPTGGEEAWVHNAMANDLTRSLKRQPFVLMEQATNQVNWRQVNSAKAPGSMRALSYQAVARGADGICFFQWRASVAGAEKFHSAMVPHGPVEQSRSFGEVVSLGKELDALSAIAGSETQATVAIVFDWQSNWALAEPSKPSSIDPVVEAQHWYRELHARNVAVDFVEPSADLSRYRFVIVPTLYALDDVAAANLTEFTRGGGTLLVTYFSGIVDLQEQVVLGGYPGKLRDVLGIWVEEWAALKPSQRQALRFADDEGAASTTCEAEHWSERVHLVGAESIATFTQGYLTDLPALTRHAFGKGTAYYLATRPDAAGRSRLVDALLKRAAVKGIATTPPGVEAASRHTVDGPVLFLINHTQDSQTVELDYASRDVLTGQELPRQIALAPFDVRILRQS